MPAHQASRLHPHALAAAILMLGLVSTWLAYAPGLGGTLHFDDHANLSGLAYVNGPDGAFRFISGGSAGPIGRPLALATFAAQAYAWPDAVEVFLRTNILIHLLNGVLLSWFLYLLGTARGQSEQRAALIATGAAAIWMLMPLLASSSLLIVQRMTTLSAVFMLAGAVAYMYARRALERRPLSGLLGMTFALGTAVALGMLAKENAVLLFGYILAVEVALLDRPASVSRRLWQAWFSVVLIAPVAALLIYVASHVPYPESTILRRDFTGTERLITQAEILWKYLYFAFLPNVPNLGLFHDAYPVQRNPLTLVAMVSLGGWFVMIAAAILWRRKAPLFAFAVAWYLLGHSLESTTLGLELYFEHRNYLPLVGPAYALIASLTQIDQKWHRTTALAVFAYAAVLGVVLFSTTSLWGSPALAAEMWHRYQPDSLRATQYLASELEKEHYSFASRRLLNRYLEAHPEAHGVRLQILVISCQIEPETDHGESIELLEESLAITRFDYSVLAAYRQLYGLVRDNKCYGIDSFAVYRLGQALLRNPRFGSSRARHNIHAVLASIGVDQRDFGMATSHFEDALAAYPNPYTLFLAIETFNSGGRYDVSWNLLAQARNQRQSRNPLQALRWQKDLDRIEAALLSLTQSQGSNVHNE
jgi:protein O-mannosyl-transferase